MMDRRKGSIYILNLSTRWNELSVSFFGRFNLEKQTRYITDDQENFD
jgi:hypothetical protein